MRNVAIITGASSGIGEAFVREIVNERGVYGSVPFQEIWIIARREEKLNSLRDELDSERIIPIALDLAEPSALSVIEEKLAEDPNTQVGLLINCAGLGKRGLVEDKTAQVIEDTVDVNCTCLSKLTRICLPYMLHPNPVFPRKDGPRVINIASTAAFLPQPGFAAYAASKAYVVSFSRALDFELRPYHVAVTTVCPGPVKTEFQTLATDGQSSEFTGFRALVVADPVKLAKASIRAAKAGRHMLVYGFSQKCLHVASKIIPTSWILWAMTLFSSRKKEETVALPDPVYLPTPTTESSLAIDSGVQVTDINEPVIEAEPEVVEPSNESIEGDSDAAKKILGL